MSLLFHGDPTTTPWPLRLGCTVDLARRQLRLAEQVVSLTTREAELLGYLVGREGQDVSLVELQREVWGHGPDVISRAVQNTVHRLKRKIEVDPAQPRHLITVHGTGFRLVRAVEVESVPVAPVEEGSFGRSKVCADLLGLLETRRVVTLSGLGGIGKTHVARQLQRTRGGLFVDLRAAVDGEGVWRSMAAGLGLVGVVDLRAQLGRALAARGAVLVVLDNAEHLVPEVQSALSVWLDEAPDARWLVTSRVRLGVEGEQLVALEPLPVPDEGDDVQRITASPSVRLFLARCTGDPGLLPEVAALVRALEGIPLALELAAARTAVTDAGGIHARLRDHLAVLRRPGGRERHDAVATTLAWSWTLLSEVERRALAQLSVFRAPFRLEAAEAVLSLPDDAFPLDVVQVLVEASLVHRVPDTDPPRLHLYAVVRAFASAHLLDPGPPLARHAGFFRLHGSPERDLSDRSPTADEDARLRDDELEDLLAAADTALASGDAALAVDLARALAAAFQHRGPLLASRRAVEAALELADVEAGLAPRRVALRVQWASVLARAARWDEVERVSAAARADRPDAEHLILLHFVDALRHLMQAHPDDAERSLQAALDGRSSRALRAQLLNLGSHLAMRRRDFEQARSMLQRSLVLAEGNPRLTRAASSTLGTALAGLGDVERALHHKSEAVRLARGSGSQHGLADALEGFAIACVEAAPERAEALFAEASTHYARLGRPRPTLLVNRAELALDLGEPERARVLASEAVAIAAEGGSTLILALSRAVLGRALLESGEPERALPVLDEAREGLPDAESRPRALLDLARATTLARLGDERARVVLAEAEAALIAPSDLIHVAAVRGEVALALGDRAIAAAALAEAEAGLLQAPARRLTRLVDALRRRLDGLPADPSC